MEIREASVTLLVYDILLAMSDMKQWNDNTKIAVSNQDTSIAGIEIVRILL